MGNGKCPLSPIAFIPPIPFIPSCAQFGNRLARLPGVGKRTGVALLSRATRETQKGPPRRMVTAEQPLESRNWYPELSSGTHAYAREPSRAEPSRAEPSRAEPSRVLLCALLVIEVKHLAKSAAGGCGDFLRLAGGNGRLQYNNTSSGIFQPFAEKSPGGACAPRHLHCLSCTLLGKNRANLSPRRENSLKKLDFLRESSGLASAPPTARAPFSKGNRACEIIGNLRKPCFFITSYAFEEKCVTAS